MQTVASHRLLPVVAVLLCSLQAAAANFSAQTEIVLQGSPVVGTSSGGSLPVNTSSGQVSDATRVGEASAGAGRGQLNALGTSISNGGVVTSVGRASAQYDDLVFSFTGEGTAPVTLPVATLNYSLSAIQTSAGPLGVIGGFNRRELTFSIVFHDSSDAGTVRWDVSGDRGQELLGGQQLQAVDVPVGAPVVINLGLVVGANARQSVAGVSTSTALVAGLRVGASSPTSRSAPAASAGFEVLSATSADGAAATPLRVFDLPEGFTVNSASMGIVDNMWVATPVPEPGTLALWLAGGFGLAAWQRRRRG